MRSHGYRQDNLVDFSVPGSPIELIVTILIIDQNQVKYTT